jgi:tRNA threonylcarbamoyladenosine biosynthesis protein TsaE
MLKEPENTGMRDIKSLEDLGILAGDFLRMAVYLPRKGRAVLVTLSGELGTGKTAFVKEVAHLLGVTATVTSPTFVLEKIYTIPAGSAAGEFFSKLVHIDAYRLEKAVELKAIDFESRVADTANIIFLEWPERVFKQSPVDALALSFEYVNEGMRRVRGAWL